MRHSFLALTISLFAAVTACSAQGVAGNQAESQKIEPAVERAFQRERRNQVIGSSIVAAVFGIGIIGNKIVQSRKKQQ